MEVSNTFLRSDNLQPLLSMSVLIFKLFPAVCISERRWKEPPEREASVHAKGSKDRHPTCAIHVKIPKGTTVGKICKPDLPKRLSLLIPLFPFLWF